MEDKEYSNVYAIPANYTDSGKLFGGMVDTRNAVEAVLLLAVVGAPELFWIPMSGTIRVVVMTVTLIPLGGRGYGRGRRLAVPVHMPTPSRTSAPRCFPLRGIRPSRCPRSWAHCCSGKRST